MRRCTEPERWASVPGADADEEEVESYLAHVGVCPFHAAVEQREEELVRGVAALARLDLSAPGAEASTAQRARRPSPAHALSRRPVRRLAFALCALAAVVLLPLILVFYRPTEQPVPVVRQEQTPRPTATAVPPPPPTTEATPSVTNTQNRQGVAPPTSPHGPGPTPTVTPRTTKGGGQVSPPARTTEQLTVADVRRIYVGAGEGEYDRRLREALIERLRASDRFTVVTGERQADAVLLREQPRGAGVSVQLVTRGGRSLWFTTQTTTAGGVEDVGDLAARIVAALTAAADKRRPPVNPPQR